VRRDLTAFFTRSAVEADLMKRKIAAIFAADIAGYSRLVAEDEEETLRRLAAYRAVVDDFIAKAGGRIFNTAGDAVLAEFPSAVEAVRCAIDIQESLRTRNMAYPPSRQMSFRIGITIGDVVERDGDLLGDGVNIAARLESLAEVGGICISRSVHEQVANKLSVQFADIGAQEVKNIPTPVHAFMVAMRREDGSYAMPQAKKKPKAPSSRPAWLWPVVVMVIAVTAISVRGFLNFTRMELASERRERSHASRTEPSLASPVASARPDVAALPAALPAVSAAVAESGQKLFAADAVPFIGDRARSFLGNEYVNATGSKAVALNINGVLSSVSGQPSDEIAKNAALEQCQKRADASEVKRPCEVYAVGNNVVYPHVRPPLPALPWLRRDAQIERPFATKDVPLLREAARARLETAFVPARKSKSLAIGPAGQFFFNVGLETIQESVRRSLESCGAIAGAACMIVAVDETFVVPVPSQMKAIGFFQPAADASITANARDDVVRKLAEASSGWNAVAVGGAGRPGLAVKAANEQAAIDDALADCGKRDSNCRVIAIGPFTVGP
jgi:class 3 adenylate cyclase